MIPEHARLEACLRDLHASRPPHRPPIRPWRFLRIGEAVRAAMERGLMKRLNPDLRMACEDIYRELYAYLASSQTERQVTEAHRP